MKKLFSLLVVLGLTALAQAATPTTIPTKLEISPWSGEVGIDVTNQYVLHGVVQENSGFIGQPWGKIEYSLFSNNAGLVKNLSVVGAFWNSVQSENTRSATGNDVAAWYEMDSSIGVKAGLAHNFTVEVDYLNLFSPSNAFGTVHELDVTVGYDDKGMWKNTILNRLPNFTGFQPFATVGQELGSSTFNKSNEPGTYVDVGIKPGMTVSVAGHAVDVSWLVHATFNVNNYYAGSSDAFGFVGFGPNFSTKIVGNLYLNASFETQFLSNQVRDLNETNADKNYIGKIGLSYKF